jgi:hypothetical protein
MEFGRYRTVLLTLLDHNVDFILVGGVAAVLLGVPIHTLDVAIVHSRNHENISRLLGALKELEAVYRLDSRGLSPNESHLAAPGHHLLRTRFGSLDVLGHIGNQRFYPDLLPHTVELEIALGVKIRVLDLATLIATKEEAGRDKDLAVLPTLRATLAEVRRSHSGPDTTSGCG